MSGPPTTDRPAVTKETTMTQYMLSVHTVEGGPVPDEAEIQRMYADVDAFNRKLMDAGVWVFGGGLEGIEATTTVDGTGAAPIVTDGPFAESKEWLGGFWILECPDLDAVLKIAAEGSAACGGRVEVRPFQAEPA
ncbi:MAG: YciI family protein [Nocardioides sp.]